MIVLRIKTGLELRKTNLYEICTKSEKFLKRNFRSKMEPWGYQKVLHENFEISIKSNNKSKNFQNDFSD